MIKLVYNKLTCVK